MLVQQPIDGKDYWQEYQEFYRIKQHKTVAKVQKKVGITPFGHAITGL
jgi:hypothetical protein